MANKKPTGQIRNILTRKQEVFVSNYLLTFDPKTAAKAAGVSHQMGLNYLNSNRFPQIKAEIDRVLAERRARNEVTADQVINELAKIAFMDYRKLFDQDGKLLPARELPEEVAGAISKLKMRKGKEGSGDEAEIVFADIGFHDKLAALQILAKHLGIGQDRNVNVNLTQVNWTNVLTTAGAVAPPDPVKQRIKMLEMAGKPGSGEMHVPEFARVVGVKGSAGALVDQTAGVPEDIKESLPGGGSDTARVFKKGEEPGQ